MNAFARIETPYTPVTPAIGRGADRLGETIGLAGARMRLERNAEIYGEGDAAEFVYRVVSGAVRISRVLIDGRRQIGAFHLAGDVFGFEPGEEHRFSAEAVSDCEIVLIGRPALLALAARDGELARSLWEHATADLARAHDHMVLLGRRSATEKVATFLLDMAAREGSRDRIELPMSRYDIADYLGLTIETVSRTLTQLESRRAIELTEARRIALRDRGALDRLAA
ncbi:MAG: helix-turn-helix domain-containing protein [Bauldia sp.]|nr:helix-turn-helix domain-containing protein [Bauldia sp.]